MPKPCIVIGITGGISTGKSTFSRLLRDLTAAPLFDADQAARRLTDDDPEVRRLLREKFGDEIFSADGVLNRAALRAIVSTDSEKKRAFEQILHPRIRRQWSTAAEESRQSGQLFLADIPLLYETEGESLCDRVVVVACSPTIQQQRLMARANLVLLDSGTLPRQHCSALRRRSRSPPDGTWHYTADRRFRWCCSAAGSLSLRRN